MTRRLARGALRGAAVLLAGLLLTVLVPSSAQAHSELQRSDPIDGAVVPVGRTTLRMWFGEPVATSASSFVLRTQAGAVVPATVSGARATTFVEITTGPLQRDGYQLDWRVVTLDDGHVTSGTLVFGAGLRPAARPSDGAPVPPPSLVLVRWLDLTGLLAAIGALTVGDRVLRPVGSAARRRARTLGLSAALVTWCAGALTPLLRGADETVGLGLWWDQTWLALVDTPAGWFWLSRQVALTVAVVALLVWRRSLARPKGPAAAALLALTAAAAFGAWAGHAATLASGGTLVAVAATGHVLAAGVWAGGLGVLACCLVPTLRGTRAQRGPLLLPVWRAYGPLAAVATVVLTATGLVQAGHHLPDLGAVTSTVYGAGVAAKTVLLVVALCLAAVHATVVHPGAASRVRRGLLSGTLQGPTTSSPHRFAATVTVEAVVLALAVLLAAVMTSTATSREELDARRPTTVHAERADGLYVTFEEVPGGPAKGRLVVRLRSIVRPDPAPVTGVDVDLGGPDGHVLVPLTMTDPDRYEGTVAEPGAGTWSAAVQVHRTRAADTVTTSSWTVASTAVGRSGFELVTTSLAAVLLALLAAVLLALLAATLPWLRRRHRDRGAAPLAPTPQHAPREKSLT